MKTMITFSALALVSNFALAEGFSYEEQIATQDLDPNITSLSTDVRNPEVSATDFRVSLNDWYQGNPDVDHVSYRHDGVEMQMEGDLFSSYEKASQDNHDLEV